MYIIISYDITSNKRRARVFNELKNYGKRVQYSVFECDLDQKQFGELKDKLMKEIDKRKDSILYYSVCGACFEKIYIQGRCV